MSHGALLCWLSFLWSVGGLECRDVARQQLAHPIPPENGYSIVFADEFSALDLSPNGSAMHSWYEGLWFSQSHSPRSDIHVDSSILYLDWTAGEDSFSTCITTMAKDAHSAKAWRYGFFEARMRWIPKPGAWPAFWLIPVQDAEGTDRYNGVKESGEIDIFEGQGDLAHTFFGTIHDWVNNRDFASRHNSFPLPRNVNFADFHVYGLMWKPGQVTWYFDDVPLHSEVTPPIVDKQTFYIVLSMQEGVNWTLADLSGVTATKLTLEVDWVRVWQKQ